MYLLETKTKYEQVLFPVLAFVYVSIIVVESVTRCIPAMQPERKNIPERRGI